MEKNNAINFKSIYYTNSPLFEREVRKAIVDSSLLDLHPNKLIKDVVENAPIFNDLKEMTDVYVSSYVVTNKETSTGKYTRYLRAIFKNPYYSAPCADTINLKTTGNDEITMFEKLKNIVNELPLYKNFKEMYFNEVRGIYPPVKRLYLGKNGCNGFIQKGDISYI